MSPHRSGTLAYWHCGGAIETRSGPIALQQAVDLFSFYGHAALAGFARGDDRAAIYCARSSLEVAAAIIDSLAWRRATGVSDVRAPREFSRLWLSEAFIVKKLLNNMDRGALS